MELTNNETIVEFHENVGDEKTRTAQDKKIIKRNKIVARRFYQNSKVF